MEKKKSYVLPIAVMFALFFMIAFVTGLQNPMAVIVKSQFSASNFLSQLGNFANFIAYAFMGIPAGMMLKRLGYKKTALAAVTVGFLGVGIIFLSGIAKSFGIYLTGAFISGFSMCMLNTVVNPMLNTLGGEGKRGNQLLQFGGALNSIAATIVPVLVGYLMGAEAGRTIEKANPVLFLAMGIFALAFIILLLVKIPEPHIEKKTDNKARSKHSPMSFRHFVLGAAAIFIYVGIEVGIPNTANLYMTTPVEQGGLGLSDKGKAAAVVVSPEYLESPGMTDVDAEDALQAEQVIITEESSSDAAMAGSVVGTYWFLMFIGRLLGGLFGGKVSSRTMLTAMSSLAIVLVGAAMLSPTTLEVSMPVFRSDLSFGLAHVPLSIMLFALCGLCTSIMWGSIFNLAVEGLGKYTAQASGIFMMMVCGGGILPLLQGYISDIAGFIPSYWVVIAGAAFILFYALFGSKNVNKDIPTQ